MTPEEKAAALAEAKTRGLPDGWRVELDVRLFSFVNMICKIFPNPNSRKLPFSNWYFFVFSTAPTIQFRV
jgi:hypothetical protein